MHLVFASTRFLHAFVKSSPSGAALQLTGNKIPVKPSFIELPFQHAVESKEFIA